MKTSQAAPDNETQEQRMKQLKQKIQSTLSHMTHTIFVMSGKGGVGKSSVSAYLALSLAKRGFRVGLMDVDLHGPSIPRLMGVKGENCTTANNALTPLSPIPNLQVMSIEALLEDKNTPTIWRGPMKSAAIRQFVADVQWGELDYLVIDSPPGTGDEPMTVAKMISNAQALVVTTPQEVALADVRKSINFCHVVSMKILGMVENMSGLICPHCGESIPLFGENGGALLAEKEGIPLLASLPIDPEVVRHGDKGDINLLEHSSKAYKDAFSKLVDHVTDTLPATEQHAQAS